MRIDLWHNGEGYFDPTAGEALSHVFAEEERKKERRYSRNVDKFIEEMEKAEKAGKKAKDELQR